MGHVVFTDVATPLTTKHYLHSLKGENYGIAQSMNRFKLPTQLLLHTATDVSGLYLVGQDTSFVGVVGVLGSGALTASYLSKRAALALAMEMVGSS
jgi:all-trans-retinol 13,14-reductase